MNRILIARVAILPLLLITPTHSNAQYTVVCPTCSSLEEELVSDAKQAQQLAQQVQQYQLQIQQYENMVTNTAALPTSIWTNVTSDIYAIRNLANAASVLTGNSGGILTRLQSAQGYTSQASVLPQNIGSQFTVWSQTTGNAANSLGRTLATQQAQQTSYASQQASIQAQSQSAAGQMQALQAGNQLAALTGTQLNQVQATLTAAAQEQATRDIVAADRQANEDAAMLKFSQYQAVTTTGSEGF